MRGVEDYVVPSLFFLIKLRHVGLEPSFGTSEVKASRIGNFLIRDWNSLRFTRILALMCIFGAKIYRASYPPAICW